MPKFPLVNKDGFQVSQKAEVEFKQTFLSSLMCIDTILANYSHGCYADCGASECGTR